MKTVLIISQHYPPENNTASRRAAQFVKYLPAHGWRPLVVTADYTAENCLQYDSEIIDQRIKKPVIWRGPVTNVQKLSRIIRYKVRILDLLLPYHRPFYWHQSAKKVLPDLIKEYNVDVIWATTPDPAAHALAKMAHLSTGVPWVADFRDVVGEIPTPIWKFEIWLEHRIRSLIERKNLISASKVITISSGLSDILEKRHKRKVICLPNGYDPEYYDLKSEIVQDKFRLVYTGRISRGRSPVILFKALKILIELKIIDTSKFNVSFYGSNRDQFEALIAETKTESVVNFVPWVNQKEIVSVQKRSSALLLLSHDNTKGIMTGKIFEYLAAKRPIISIPGDGDCTDELIIKTNTGLSCSSVSEVVNTLSDWYNQWKTTGIVEYAGYEKEISKYSRRNQAMALAKILNEVVDA